MKLAEEAKDELKKIDAWQETNSYRSIDNNLKKSSQYDQDEIDLDLSDRFEFEKEEEEGFFPEYVLILTY